MFGNMRQLPEEVVTQWDQGQPDEHPYQKRLRDVRLAKEAKQRFVYFCVMGVSLVVGFLVGHFTPLFVLGALVALVVVALIAQAALWMRRQMVSMEASRKIDDGIKIVEPRIINDTDKKEERAA